MSDRQIMLLKRRRERLVVKLRSCLKETGKHADETFSGRAILMAIADNDRSIMILEGLCGTYVQTAEGVSTSA